MIVAIDSRSVTLPEETIFVAIKGNSRDGHDYIPELYRRGVKHFVVSEWHKPFDSMKDASFVVCEDTLAELQKMASEYRKTISAEVVGITGSNGKTVVKEWIAQLIEDDIPLCRSPRSYNSQIGVPLSLLDIDRNCQIALIEAGMSKKGEMSKLQKIIDPKVGIFTHLGDAHSENFTSLNEKLLEKCLLFKGCDVVICRDGFVANTIASTLKPNAKMIVWGLKSDRLVFDANRIEVSLDKVTNSERVVKLTFNGDTFTLDIPFSDEASFENCITAVCYLLYKKFSINTIVQRVKNLQPIAMRMEIKEGVNHCTLIKDYYNSDLASFALAINTLSAQDPAKQKVVILSDFVDIGSDGKKVYQNVADLLKKYKVSTLIGVGEALSRYKLLFDLPTSRFYPDTEAFLKGEERDFFQNMAILIKGARRYKFEYIANFLQKQSHTTLLEVDFDAMGHNLNYFRSLIPQNTKIAVMVKAFSYGSGAGEVANFLQFNGVNYLMVAFADEGVELRSKGITIPIAVMNPESEAFDNMIEFGLEPEIYSLELLYSFDASLKHHGIENYPVHLKINTGMNRSGIDKSDISSLTNYFSNKRNVKICSMFSHLAASDDPSQDDFTIGQILKFNEIVDIVQSHFDYKIMRHILNSAGIERFQQFAFDMVRLGIGLHGISAITKQTSPLLPVSSFKTHIASIRVVPAGETIGYGRRGVVTKESKIAVIPVGYADGLNRHLSCSVGEMLVKGVRVPIIGSVCMDACMLDISETDAKVGDEVEIFGKNIPVTEIAAKLDTIPYEILTAISQRVKRVYFKEL